MADYLIKGETLTNIADEVRELSGTTASKTTSSMLSDINAANTEISSQSNIIDQILTAIDELPEAGSGGLDTSDATAVSSDILSGKTAYVDGKKITGNIATKAATTYTPSTSNQTISSGTYLAGKQTILGDANLIAENIKSGTTIFGVTGTYEGTGGGASIETVSLTITNYSFNDLKLYYLDNNLISQCITLTDGEYTNLSIVKDSIITIITNGVTSTPSSTTLIGSGNGSYSFIISGNCYMTFNID